MLKAILINAAVGQATRFLISGRSDIYAAVDELSHSTLN